MIFILSLILKFIFFALAVTPFAAFGLVLGFETSLYWGVFFGVICNLVFHFWGDRFVLSKLWGRKARRMSWLEKMAKNVEVVTRISNVKVYTTDFMPNEITVIDGGKDRKAIVLGSEALRVLTRVELESVFVKTFFDLKTKKWRLFTILSSYFIPYVLILKMTSLLIPNNSMRMIMSYLMAPTSIIKSSLCGLAQMINGEDSALPEKYRASFETAMSKLALLETTIEDHATYELIRHNILAPRMQTSLLKIFDKII